jgi:hypothetical protein
MKNSEQNHFFKSIIGIHLILILLIVSACQDEPLEKDSNLDSNVNLKKSTVLSYEAGGSNSLASGRIANNQSGAFANLTSSGDLQYWSAWIGTIGNPQTEVGGVTYLDPNIMGTGFNFVDYFSADWNGDGYSDLICRNASGGLYFFPFNRQTFKYPNGSQGVNVGNGFNFVDYLVGDWTGDGKADLIGRNSSGTLYLYPFINNTFIGNGGGKIVGTNFNFTHYFIADWNNNKIADLICRDGSGGLYFFQFANNSFTTGINVGNGFNSSNYYIGEWTGDNFPDLVTNSSGTLRLYPFVNNTFIGNGGGSIIGTYPNYRNIFTRDISFDGISDLVMVDQTGLVSVAKFRNGSYSPFYLSAPHYWNFSRYFQSNFSN